MQRIPVAGPFFDFSVPEPTGIVAIVAPATSSLLGLVSVLMPVIATGNTTVVLASELRPLPAITLTEVLATSDLPGGVVNMLTGKVAEVAPWLASHADVNGLDLTGAPLALWRDLEVAAADNLKRVRRPDDVEPDWSRDPGTDRLTSVPRDQDRLASARRLGNVRRPTLLPLVQQMERGGAGFLANAHIRSFDGCAHRKCCLLLWKRPTIQRAAFS